MNVEIVSQTLILEAHGFGDTARVQDYTQTAFRLSGRMWEIVKANKLPNEGKNIWIYGPNDTIFAGVKLTDPTTPSGLELKVLQLDKYAYFKHVGPYNLIKQTGQAMTDKVIQLGYSVTTPYIEIYGHWTNDDTKLETELIMALK